MPTQVIQMRAQGTGGTENDVASVDIPEDGRISEVHITSRATLDADAEFSDVELSFISTGQFGTNDARGVIATVGQQMGLLTSGAGITAINHVIPFQDLRVSGGERLHMHMQASAGVTTTCVIQIHFDGGRAPRRSARRR